MERKWFVINDANMTASRHESHEAAVKCATALAEENMGIAFFIVEAKQRLRAAPVASVWEVE